MEGRTLKETFCEAYISHFRTHENVLKLLILVTHDSEFKKELKLNIVIIN